jgi:hypothetical protein
MLGYYDILKETFILPEQKIIEENLQIFHKNVEKPLSTIYFDKIYEQILNLYNNNNMKSLNNIIDNYNGDFINEDYIFNKNIL